MVTRHTSLDFDISLQAVCERERLVVRTEKDMKDLDWIELKARFMHAKDVNRPKQ